MDIITNLRDKRLEKQQVFERKVLKEISLQTLKDTVDRSFSLFFNLETAYAPAIEDGCIDIAIESYLLGASMSRFGYYGESVDQARNRCATEEKYLVDYLFDYLQYWDVVPDEGNQLEGLYKACQKFINIWWHEGFKKGEIRYKLRLH